jgi:two-component system, NarL family, nitrate/nitrite response regulator NarL
MEQILRSVPSERSVPGLKPRPTLPAPCRVSDQVPGGFPGHVPGPVGGPVEASRPIRIAIIDPYPLFRLGVVQSIARCKDLLVVGEGATLGDARRIAREASPDILIFDISMPDGSAEVAQAIARACGGCKLAVLTSLETSLSVSKALTAGVKGYILKGISGFELASVIRLIHAGQPFVSPELAFRLLADANGAAGMPKPERNPRVSLNYREQQLLDHFLQGLTNKEIATHLNLRVGTVKHYATQLFKKMQVRNRLEAIVATQQMSCG